MVEEVRTEEHGIGPELLRELLIAEVKFYKSNGLAFIIQDVGSGEYRLSNVTDCNVGKYAYGFLGDLEKALSHLRFEGFDIKTETVCGIALIRRSSQTSLGTGEFYIPLAVAIDSIFKKPPEVELTSEGSAIRRILWPTFTAIAFGGGISFYHNEDLYEAIEASEEPRGIFIPWK